MIDYPVEKWAGLIRMWTFQLMMCIFFMIMYTAVGIVVQPWFFLMDILFMGILLLIINRIRYSRRMYQAARTRRAIRDRQGIR